MIPDFLLPLPDPVWFGLMWAMGYSVGLVFKSVWSFVKIATR